MALSHGARGVARQFWDKWQAVDVANQSILELVVGHDKPLLTALARAAKKLQAAQ